MRKIVISGGPYSGKTTLLHSLKDNFPQYEYVPEPASIVLSEVSDNESLYWRDVFNSPLKFCTLCVEQSIRSEGTIPRESDFVFMDRSLVDTIAYARRDHCEELIPRVMLLAREAMYHTVLFCEPVGTLKNRIEDNTEAATTHELLRDVYEEMGIPIISVPPLTVEERTVLVGNIFDLQ